MERNKRYSLLLLSGGKSNRMGTDKAALLYEGKSFLEHMLDKAGRLGIDKFYIAGGSSPCSDVQAVADIYPDRGPLGGLHVGMLAMDTPYCLVLPVDAPTLPVEILEELLCEHEKQPGEKTGDKYVDTKKDIKLNATACINCGQCVKVCPVGALTEKDAIHKALAAIDEV